MIPHPRKLPPIPEEEPPLGKILKPLLGLIFVMGLTGGILWLYSSGIRQAANEEMNIMGGLRTVAGELWSTGSAGEIRHNDPDLATELARLGKMTGLIPQIVVIAAENHAGQPVASHELIYMLGKKQVIAVRVYLDEDEGKIDLLSHRTGPEFMETLAPSK